MFTKLKFGERVFLLLSGKIGISYKVKRQSHALPENLFVCSLTRPFHLLRRVIDHLYAVVRQPLLHDLLEHHVLQVIL